MDAVRNRLAQARDAITSHPWTASLLGGAAAATAMAPGAVGAAATGLGAIAAANPVGLAAVAATGAATWAARRYLPAAQGRATALLHATPAIALIEIERAVKNLNSGRSISIQERAALVETLSDFQNITRMTVSSDIQAKVDNLRGALEALAPVAGSPHLLVISDACREAIAAIHPDFERLVAENRGAIPGALHHFHEFLASLTVEATPELRLAYSALNELLSAVSPTREQLEQTAIRLTAASHIYTSAGGEIPPQIDAASQLFHTLAMPLSETQKGTLRAALTTLGETISSQSGDVERLLDRLTYHVFGEASGLIPKTRAELTDLLRQAPSPLLNAAGLLDRLRWGNTSSEHIASTLSALGSIENPSPELTSLLSTPTLISDTSLLRTISVQLDERIKARQGLIWNQVSELRSELLNPDRGLVKEALDLMAPIMARFTDYLKVAPLPLRQLRDALVLLEANPTSSELKERVRAAMTTGQFPALEAALTTGTNLPQLIQATKTELQLAVEAEQGEIQTLVDGLFNSLNVQLHHTMQALASAARCAPQPLRDQLLALLTLNDAMERGTFVSELRPFIASVIRSLPHNHSLAAILNDFQLGNVTREPVKTALSEAIQEAKAQIAAQSGTITQAIQGMGETLYHEVNGGLQRGSHAITAQIRSLVQAGRRLIASAPDHPIKSLFERILDTRISGHEAFNEVIYTELGKVQVLIPRFRERVLEGISRENLGTDPERLLQNCFRVMREIVEACPEEQQHAFYGSIYDVARREDSLNPDIGGPDWGQRQAFSVEKAALTFYGFAEWHKKVHHFTAHPLYQFRKVMLTERDSSDSTLAEKNGHILEALDKIPIDGFKNLVLNKLYHHFSPAGSVPHNWAEGHLADDIGVTLELTWQAIRETVGSLTQEEASFFYKCVSEVSAKSPLETNGEAWARTAAFDEAYKERAFAGLSWFMVKRAGGATDVGHAVPPGIVGAQLGVGGGIENHPIFGTILNVLTKVPAIGLSGVTSWIEGLLQGFLTSAVDTDEHGSTPSQKIEIKGVIAHAIERLRQAHEVGSLQGYITALRGVFGSLSKYPILINGIQVPLSSGERVPSSYDRETALLEEVEGLDQVPQDEEDSPAEWRSAVDAERRSLEKNARFMILYKVFYEEPRFGVGEDNPRLAMDAHINARIRALPGTPEFEEERERLREQLGYYNLERGSNHFHTIMERVRAFPEEKREKAFKEILFEEIGKKSKIKSFFNRIFYFLLSGILSSIIGPYISNIITEIRQGVRGLEAGKGKAHPIPPAPMDQLSAGMIAIRGAYKEWALDTRGQHRDKRVKTLLDDPKYNQNMTPKEIHDATANTLINYFIPDSPWNLKTSFFNVCSFCSRDEFPSSPLASKICTAVKWIPFGIAGAILAPVFDILRSLAGSLGTTAKRWLVEKTVIRLDVIPTLVDTAKNSLYDTSAYQLALNELLCNQLAEVWKIMDPSRKGGSEASKKYLAIAEQQPESTKDAIKALVENLFGTMQLRGHRTPEAMAEATGGGGSILTKARDQLNSLFLPDVVDNIVKLIMVGYQSVIQKDQMERQLAQLMKTVNGAMVGASNEHANWSAENIRQRNDALSRSINHYKDLILSQAIKDAVAEYLTNPEKRIIEAAKTRFQETKDLMIERGEESDSEGDEDVSHTPAPEPFIPRFREALTECQTDPSPENIGAARAILTQTLHELRNSSRIFEADVQQGKISQETADHLQEGRLQIIASLENLSHEFSTVFQTNLSITEAAFARPRIEQIMQTFAEIETALENPPAADTATLESRVGNIGVWIQDLKSHPSLATALRDTLTSFTDAYETSKAALRTLVDQKRTTTLMQQIRLTTVELLQQKQAAAARSSPLAQLTHDSVSQLSRSLEALIAALPEPFDRARLKSAATKLWQENVTHAITHAGTITTYIDGILSAGETTIQAKLTLLRGHRLVYTEGANAFTQQQEAEAGVRTASQAEHLGTCLEHLQSLEAVVNGLTPPPFIATNLKDLGSNSSVNRWICNMIFQELKKRSTQFIGMVSDPIVFQQLIRQGMLFVLEQLKTPQEFAELTKSR